jgi:hypothetical protein
MRRRAAIILGVLVVVMAIGLEIGSRYWVSSTICVVISNDGAQPMDDVVASYADTQVSLGQVAAGTSTKVWFNHKGRKPLVLKFMQKGNPMTGYEVDDFDPVELRESGSRLVLVVNGSQFQRYIERDDSIKTPPRLLDRLVEWIRDELH